VLTEARDAILGVMQETKTTPDQLSGYLEFNALLQSSNPKDLEEALRWSRTSASRSTRSSAASPRAAASTC
jgi:hypothetical protein